MVMTALVVSLPVVIFPLMQLEDIGRSIVSYVDLTLLLLFIAAVPFAIRHFQRFPGSFQSSLVVCVLLFACSQAYGYQSTRLFNPPYIAAQSLTLCCYLAPPRDLRSGQLRRA